MTIAEIHTENCQEPSNLNELVSALYENNNNFHNSYYLMDPLRNATLRQQRKYKRLIERNEQSFNMNLQGTIECPTNLQPSTERMISTCPVYWELNYDVSRVPKTIIQARCSCTNCLLRQTENKLKDYMEEYLCRPVHFYERVLRRIGCENNVFVYKTVIEPIKVGCTCAVPIQS